MAYQIDTKQSTKQAELIFSLSTVLFAISTIGLIIGAIVFFYFAITTINKDFNWLNLIYTLVMLVCIFPAWVLKQVMDGIAMSLYNTAAILDRQNSDALKEIDDEEESEDNGEVEE